MFYVDPDTRRVRNREDGPGMRHTLWRSTGKRGGQGASDDPGRDRSEEPT